MNQLPLDKKRFHIQILIAAVISVIFQLLIDPYIYNPYVRNAMAGGFIDPGNAIVITSMSLWFFSFSFAFLYYQDNEIINSYLLCAFIPLIGIVGIEFFSLLFWDFLHIPPVIIIIYVIWKQRNTINLRYALFSSIILSIWLLTVRLLGFNYTGLSIPLTIGAMCIWPFLNLLLSYIIIKLLKKE
ncbi:MAG: hypothetical protein ACTSRG_09140 [Candidatus Helarchaeota archaeon]